eukprot:1160921-Pelagomonas_calceolata.AAC.11
MPYAAASATRVRKNRKPQSSLPHLAPMPYAAASTSSSLKASTAEGNLDLVPSSARAYILAAKAATCACVAGARQWSVS